MSKIWAVFEPRSHTVCRRVFQEVLPDAFGPADKTLIGPIHPSRLTRIPRQQLLDLPTLTGDIEARGREAWHLERVSDIVELLKEQVGPGDVVCVMSNGDFGGLTEQLKKSLSP